MMPTADDQIPSDFTIPEALRPAVAFELTCYSTVVEVLADRLFSAGLPEVQANTVAIDWLVRQACELGMYTAIAIDNRPPSRERWIKVMGEVFDQTLAAREAAVAEHRQ